MSYFLWGCRRILTLITLRSERVKVRYRSWGCLRAKVDVPLRLCIARCWIWMSIKSARKEPFTWRRWSGETRLWRCFCEWNRNVPSSLARTAGSEERLVKKKKIRKWREAGILFPWFIYFIQHAVVTWKFSVIRATLPVQLNCCIP